MNTVLPRDFSNWYSFYNYIKNKPDNINGDLVHYDSNICYSLDYIKSRAFSEIEDSLFNFTETKMIYNSMLKFPYYITEKLVKYFTILKIAEIEKDKLEPNHKINQSI